MTDEKLVDVPGEWRNYVDTYTPVGREAFIKAARLAAQETVLHPLVTEEVDRVDDPLFVEGRPC